MSKELIVQQTSKYIGKMETPILVIEVQQKKSPFQQFVDGFKAFCDYAATTKAGSGEMDIGLEMPNTKPVKKLRRK